MNIKNILLAGIACFSLCACHDIEQQTSEELQNQKQEEVNKQAVEQVGMPSVVNFQEKRLLKQIFELRDTALVTYSYTQDLNGHFHFLCNSIGYGIPYSTQYTNPLKTVTNGAEGITTVAQADPNGLYSPPSAAGTWVLCTDPNGSGKQMPIYVEPNVVVSPFKLKSVE